MKIYWPMKVFNKEIRNQANISPTSEQIYWWNWKFIGQILRMDANQHPKMALTWAPEGKRRRGRPRETWHRTIEKERGGSIGF